MVVRELIYKAEGYHVDHDYLRFERNDHLAVVYDDHFAECPTNMSIKAKADVVEMGIGGIYLNQGFEIAHGWVVDHVITPYLEGGRGE